MTEMELVLTLRHCRVMPKIFLLLERLGADCLNVQGQLQPGLGGKLKLLIACPPSLAHRVKTQLARFVDVCQMHDCADDQLAQFQSFANQEQPDSQPAWGGSIL